MSSSSDFDDELAGHLTVLTMIGIIMVMVVAFIAAIAAVVMIVLLWQVYRRHGRAGEPEADYLRRIGSFAAAGLILAFLALAADPAIGFWAGVITFSVWTYKVYEVGLRQDLLGSVHSEEEADALSSLATYLAPFDPTRKAALIPAAEIIEEEKKEPLSMVVRVHAFGERVRSLGTAAETEDFRGLGEVFAYLITPAPASLATETNVRLLLRQ
jgi:hypothetical protein